MSSTYNATTAADRVALSIALSTASRYATLHAVRRVAPLCAAPPLAHAVPRAAGAQVLLPLVRVPASAAPTLNAILYDFLYKAVLGALWGVGLGVLAISWISSIFNTPVIEITITLAAAYLTFFSAEALQMSGVLAVVALGLVMGKEGKARISPEVGHFLEEFWEMLAFMGNTLVFALSGLVMAYRLEWGASFSAYDVGALLLLYVLAFVVRAAVVAAVWRAEGARGRRVDWRDAVVTTWGGLRGAVGLALALMVFYEQADICKRVRDTTLFHTSGIVLLTVVVNSTSMRKVPRNRRRHTRTADTRPPPTRGHRRRAATRRRAHTRRRHTDRQHTHCLAPPRRACTLAAYPCP